MLETKAIKEEIDRISIDISRGKTRREKLESLLLRIEQCVECTDKASYPEIDTEEQIYNEYIAYKLVLGE